MSLADVQARISDAARAAGRDPASITLVAVSKFQPVEKIEKLIADGQRVFGENRVAEAARKFTGLRDVHPGLSLHMIGHLQTNKALDAVRIFDVIQSVDSERLALALGDAMRKAGKNIPCFVQVNTGAEPQKGGVAVAGLSGLLRLCREGAGIEISGLMCLPPAHDAPDPHFTLLRRLAADHDLPFLSMGMSGDFESAIRLGATHIRIGTAVFGERII